MPAISLSALLHVSRAGLLTQQAGLDVTANNIANVSTTGFKRSRAEFQELLNDRLEEPPEGNNRAAGEAAGARLVDTQHIFSQGVIEATDFQWDLAIEGEGFFQVLRNDGTLAYTRDGTFRLDGEGRVVNADGHLLQPEVIIPPDAEETMITGEGKVMVRRTGELEPQVIATINLARFTNPAGLETAGQNLFLPTDASGAAQLAQAGSQGYGTVISYALEQSNIDLSNEVVDMISAQRAYSMMARALRTTDEMMGLATQIR
ncbi:MAG: Flagellar basal-body rod protein FlgG [Anaerolineae bacterium]|nr:Flagellar basal-body rod protein FlgG [Anaerolineae bacterium]